MKKVFSAIAASALLLAGFSGYAQKDKSARASEPAEVKTTLENGGAVITINYSRPSVKGREIGKDLEPMEGKIWRTGANEATIFETSKDVRINGQVLPAGKYGLFTIFNGKRATLIFNKTWNQWGAFEYKEADDQLRVETKVYENNPPTEKLTIDVNKDGDASLLWGGKRLSFKIDSPKGN